MIGFLNPETVLKQLRLQKSMVAADFGSGSGGWVIPLAKKLEEGKVFAIDILEEPLSALSSKAKTEKLFNIQTIRSDIEKTSKMISESCDLVLMTNLLFQIDDKKQILEEAKRVLKKSGMVLVVDWKADNVFGPKEGRVSSDEVKKFAEEVGLKFEKEFEAGPHHYGLVFIK
jgi:ubiquinone/menaquinone biosynthesis C-methylase UbiE